MVWGESRKPASRRKALMLSTSLIHPEISNGVS